MAQYGKTFYGSSYYGGITAFSSTYTSKIFDAEEPFTGPISIELSGRKPVRAYGRADKEVQPNGNWTGTTDYRTTDIGATMVMRLSASDIRIVYKTQTVGDQFMEVKVVKTDGSVLFQQNVNTVGSGVDASFGTSFPYQEVTVTIKTISTTSGTPFIIRRLDTVVTDFTFEVGFGSTRDNLVFQNVPLTQTNNIYRGNTTTVTNKRYVQFKVHLASSDDAVTPIIEYVKMNSLNTTSRATNGYWSANINMDNVAQAAGVTFSKLVSFDWTETKPTGTDIGIRSRAAATAGSSNFGPETALYRKGYTRLRLPDDRTEAYIITKKPIDPREFLGTQFNSIQEWLNIESILSMPLDEVGQEIEYEFYDVYPDETNAGIVPVATVNPYSEDVSRVMSLFNEKTNKLFYLVIRLKRLSTKATPVVDWVRLSSSMEFKQVVSRTSDNLSAVDNGTGTKELWKLNGSEFSWPTNTNGNISNQTLLAGAKKDLQIIDETSRVGVSLYFKSKVDATQQRNLSNSLTDTIVGRALAEDAPASTSIDPKKLYFHYHYNGSTAQYLIKDEHEMGSDYTPSLLTNKKYRYLIKNGWPENRIRIGEPLTWTELAEQLNVDETKLKTLNPNKLIYEGKLIVGQEIIEPNESLNARVTVSFKGKGTMTDVSAHNTNGNSIVVGELVNGDYGFTEWVSEEKIYTGYINLNDIREMYVRQQPNGSLTVSESEYRVATGDTYEKIAKTKKVNAIDLRKFNQDKELIPGQMIRIPSPLTLPFLAPNVLFQDADGMTNIKPYEIAIIENSVKKRDGTILDEDVIIPPGGGRLPLDYTMVESAPIAVKITRGNVANGRDLLQHKNVRRVISIKDSNNITYTPYTEIGGIKTGDFVLDGNYIWWKGQQQTSKEPAAAVEYTVTYTYDDIKDVIITLDSRYKEKAGYDVLWRSPEVKEYEGVATPLQDFKLEIAPPTDFEGFNDSIADAGYVVEDNDLWVKTYVVEEEGKFYLVGTLDGQDPTKNWYPQIKSGYYYLQDQEYYMYAEPIVNRFAKEDVPIAKNTVTRDGKLYLDKDTTNYFLNSTMNTKEKKRIYSFTGEASLTWDQIDAQAKTWNQIDAEGKTWGEL